MTIFPSRLRASTRRSLAWLGSRSWFRPFGMALVRRLNRRTFHLLKATPGVHEVYVRGSFARGDFVPLSSDVDLTIILTAAGEGQLDQCISLHRAMRKVRRRNPSVRDWWHHMILVSELPVVEAFSDLYGSHEWRDEKGHATAPRSGWTDERLRDAAAWSQLCLWSGSAFHDFLHPHERVHNFEAGVKKTLRFADRMGVRAPLSCPSSARRRDALVEIFRTIGRGAEKILGRTPSDGALEAATPSTSAAAPRPGIIRTERALFVLLENSLSDAELLERFDDLAHRELPKAAVTYVLPTAAISIWPFPAESVTCGAPPALMPLPLGREVYLFEALFLPSALRLALSFPDAKSRLRRVVASLQRAQRLYGNSEPPGAPAESDTRALFDHGSSLCAALQESLLAFADDRKAGRKTARRTTG